MTDVTPATAKVRPARPPKPVTHKVRKVNPDDYVNPGAVVFQHESEGVVRNYVKQHHPRGREVYVETASGVKEHYSADLDAQGDEDGGWTDFHEDEDA